ncbi:MAG: hypothetical protein JXA24_06615 [Proteobacteria bacterium]|nr:hypothetical protein [Pseudomonadota bacterium]
MALYQTTGQGSGNRFNVLALSGSWREMGRQYGILANAEINRFYDTVVADYLMAGHGVPMFPDYSVYQVVALPADRTIWLRTPGLSGWEKVNLGALFTASP